MEHASFANPVRGESREWKSTYADLGEWGPTTFRKNVPHKVSKTDVELPSIPPSRAGSRAMSEYAYRHANFQLGKTIQEPYEPGKTTQKPVCALATNHQTRFMSHERPIQPSEMTHATAFELWPRRSLKSAALQISNLKLLTLISKSCTLHPRALTMQTLDLRAAQDYGRHPTSEAVAGQGGQGGRGGQPDTARAGGKGRTKACIAECNGWRAFESGGEGCFEAVSCSDAVVDCQEQAGETRGETGSEPQPGKGGGGSGAGGDECQPFRRGGEAEENRDGGFW